MNVCKSSNYWFTGLFFNLLLLVQLMVRIELIVHAQTIKPPKISILENLAYGKSYVLEPPPNYEHCTDNEDFKQLTDGQYTNGRFWTQESTVGWGSRHAIVTIDLGKVFPISGVSYNTAAGVADVKWPSDIHILVSDDGKIFYEAGELVALSEVEAPRPKDEGEIRCHRFRTTKLKTHGRYLCLVVFGHPYIFVDEIEVYYGKEQWLENKFANPGIHDVKEFAPEKYIGNIVQKRIQSDIQAIRTSLASNLISNEITSDISVQLDIVEKELKKPDSLESDGDSRNRIPLNPLHESVFKIQAMQWRALGIHGIHIWQNGLWDPLEPIHIPSKNTSSLLNVNMMRNEYRAGAFSISNANDKDMEAQIEINFPFNPSCITVHEVDWIPTSAGNCYPSRLTEIKKIKGKYHVEIASGITRQIWFTFNTKGIYPGLYQGRIDVTANDQKIDVPLILKIYPLFFPDQQSLHLGGWDYTNLDSFGGITPTNREKIIRHLREHLVDSPWATSSVMPFENQIENGLNQPNVSNFDDWVELWPDATHYYVFLNVQKKLDNHYMGTSLFNEKVKRWISFWADHSQSKELKPNQLSLLLVDEPNTKEEDEIILQWAKALHAANTKIKIWENPIHKKISAANQEMINACDVICLNRWSMLSEPDDNRTYLNKLRKQGKELAIYSANGPAIEMDPYFFYRLQSWMCWEYGATSSFFWSFTDTGASSDWNQSDLSRSSYVPFFLDATAVVAGKHMEAIREGVEDYEYLKMLQDEVRYLEQSRGQCDLLETAQKLLEEAPKRVSQIQGKPSPYWSEKRERESADQIRKDILDMLVKIQNY